MKKLKAHMIDPRRVFSPMSSLPMHEKRVENSVAYRVGSSAINLPSGHNLNQDEITYICDVINKLL